MIICGLPSVVCGLIVLFFMPESPKFTFLNGDEEKTLNILQKVFKINTGKSIEEFTVKSLVRNEEFQEAYSGKSRNLLQFMWSQTAPLFKHPHLKNTLRACFIQFCIFNTSNGFWTFFPEITNRIAIWTDSSPSHDAATVCQILDETKIIPSLNRTSINPDFICVTKLESSTYGNAYILNVFYVFGWLFLSLIINRVGKLVIITTLLFSCGVCGFSLIFVNVPIVSNYLYVVLLLDGLALTVLNASTVELFPTQFRFVFNKMI
jgi:MFS transporter, VNT family, synaptic vesicle glycoprotein 2